MFYWSVFLFKCWFQWNTSLCMFKHSSLNISYMLHSFSTHIILLSKSSAIFFLSAHPLERCICYCIFSHLRPPILLCFQVCLRSSPCTNSRRYLLLFCFDICFSIPKYNSVVSFLQFLYLSLPCCEWWSFSCSSRHSFVLYL